MRGIERIKSIPIASYLERKGFSVPTKGNICAFWRGDKNPSVSIDRDGNRWYDHGEGKGGSVIDLAMAIEGCSFSKAADILEAGDFSVASFSPTTRQDKKPGIVVEEVRLLQHPALLQYLNGRGISTSLASIICKEIYYRLENRPDYRYFAVGFQNCAGGWELRNQKIKLATSKHYSFIDNGGSHLAVFEGFIDFLSYLEIPESIFPKRAPENYLILNSVALAYRALCDIKAGKLGLISTLCLYLDADDAGRKTSDIVHSALEEVGIRDLGDAREIITSFGQQCKDINDALKCYQQQTQKQLDIVCYE